MMDYSVIHEVKCSGCKADLTRLNAVKVHFSIDGEAEFDRLLSVDAEGHLGDTQTLGGLIAKGFHAGSACFSCGEQLEELVNSPEEIIVALQTLVKMSQEGRDSLMGEIQVVCKRAIDMISSFSREKVIHGELKDGILTFDPDAFPDGVVIQVKDRDHHSIMGSSLDGEDKEKTDLEALAADGVKHGTNFSEDSIPHSSRPQQSPGGYQAGR